MCGIKLISFIDKATPKAKLNEIKKTGQPIIFCAKPINFAKYAARIFDIPNLRPSYDDLSIEPYKSIAFEIFEEFGEEIDAVFMFPTSASSLIGTARGFLQIKDKLGNIIKIPKIIAVQTGEITSIADKFCSAELYESKNDMKKRRKISLIPGALGVKTTRRTKEAVELIKKTEGAGIIVSLEEIAKADAILKRYDIFTSKEGAATLAGAIKLRDPRNVICLLTGRDYKETNKDVDGDAFYAESYTDVRNIVDELKV